MATVGEINGREEFVVEWSIKDFSSLATGVSYFSPSFFFDNSSWCIEYGPKGGAEWNLETFIQLHRQSSGPSIRIEYALGWKALYHQERYGMHVTDVFNEIKHHGHQRMCTREYPGNKEYLCLPPDVIAFLCSIKRPEFANFANKLQGTNLESIQFNSTSNSVTTTGEVNGREDFVVEWSIKDFLSLPAEGGVSFVSPSFSFENESWFMEIYPNGEKQRESYGLIVLYLHRKFSVLPISIECSSGLKDIKGECYGSTFNINEREPYREIFWHVRNILLTNKYTILPSNTLTLLCRIMHPKSTECSSTEVSSKLPKIFRTNKVFQHFKQLFLNQNHFDIMIKVKGQEFKAHRNILAARSPVFESTFRHNMKEKETGIVDVKDCDPSSFSDFLCFLYCGEIDTISGENVFSLFTTAHKYEVQDLKDVCLEFMKENISVDTFCDTITFVLQHSEKEFLTLAKEFFAKNTLKIVKTVQWQKFTADNPTQSNELMVKALEAAAVPNESFVFSPKKKFKL